MNEPPLSNRTRIGSAWAVKMPSDVQPRLLGRERVVGVVASSTNASFRP
jgi:hypothetical protein